MRMFRFVYPFFSPPGRPAGPYLPLRISNPKTHAALDWDCLVDTGADSCLFTRPIAEIIGHTLKAHAVKSSATFGVGGIVSVWKHTFSIALLHPSKPDLPVWQSPRLLVDCIDSDVVPPLIGTHDFLSGFRITLDYPKQVTIIQWGKK